MLSQFEKYLKHLKVDQLLKSLGAQDANVLSSVAQHFETKEAYQRDRILRDYFGRTGLTRIVNAIVDHLLQPPELPSNAAILDVGAGNGFFTSKIARKILAQHPHVSVYAMDLTPAMLLSLTKKDASITPIVGLAENIKDSIIHARRYFDVPLKFDAVFSTLMLHHAPQTERVFESIRKVLRRRGKAVILDLCEHSFEDFKTSMGDVHLGFKPEEIRRIASNYFASVKVEKLPEIECKCSGKAAQIFVASMQNP